MSKSGERTQSVKIVLIMLGITLWSLSILVRLVQLQIVRHEEYAKEAHNKQQNTREVSAPRGVIYDSQMNVLASSVKAHNIEVAPKLIDNKHEAAYKLAPILNKDPEELLSELKNPDRQSYFIIARKVDPKLESSIRDLGIKVIIFHDVSKRVYPHNEQASHILGFVNRDDNGGEGLELQYDKELKGKEGFYSYDVDGNSQRFHVNVEKPPVQGNSLVLSIDRTIQFTAERELAAAVENSGAKAGTVIVMESDTGRILALANWPKYDPNIYNTYGDSERRNRAVTDIFEPGSTFKVVVATAALDARETWPDEIIDCQNGSIKVGNHVFHDVHKYELLTFTQILEHSSNVGAVILGTRLGRERLYDALKNFGFGAKTGVDLPGEIVGLVHNLDEWSGLSIGSISFGHEVGVTSMQILNAINSIANGGHLVRPSVVDRIIDENHNIIRKTQPERIQIMSHRTAEAVSEAFEGVILRGTGKNAALEGYRAAGKTGTAEKIVNGRYSKEKHVSSFIGFAPLPNPKVTILVQLDEPRKGHYASTVCAPYFKNIAQEVLVYLGIPPDLNLPLPVINPAIADNDPEDFMPEATPAEPLVPTGTGLFIENPSNFITVQMETIVMPDFRGLSKKVVLNKCIDLGIQLQYKGSGMAIFQSPLPGTEIPVGATCNVTFTKKGLKENVASLTRILSPERNVGLEPHPAERQVNLHQSSSVSP